MSAFKLILIIGAAFIAGSAARAQSAADALRDFDFVVQVIKQDYAGYPNKTAGMKAVEFATLVKTKRAELNRAPADEGKIVNDLLAWFKDNHTGLSVAASAEPVATVGKDDGTLAKQGPFIRTDQSIPDHIRTSQPLIGTMWASADGSYQAVILPDPTGPRKLAGVVTLTKSAAWSPGQVKFALEPIAAGWSAAFNMRDHSRQLSSATFVGKGSVLRFPELSIDWVRVDPAPVVPVDHIVPSQDFFLRRLSDKTVLLRLPNFFIENRERIERLLESHRSLLERTPNLIIDARGNNGGSDGSYEKLMEWLYTRPIYSIGAEFRASPRNALLYEELAQQPDFPPATVSLIRRIVSRMRDSDRDWVSPDDRPFTITTFPRVLPNPRRVGILATGAGSSGDQFILDARQSRKVTTFGGPTAGVIDYSNVLETPTPSKRYVLRWATSRSMRLPQEPIDNVGIQPDVPFGGEVEDPITYVESWLERQAD